MTSFQSEGVSVRSSTKPRLWSDCSWKPADQKYRPAPNRLGYLAIASTAAGLRRRDDPHDRSRACVVVVHQQGPTFKALAIDVHESFCVRPKIPAAFGQLSAW